MSLYFQHNKGDKLWSKLNSKFYLENDFFRGNKLKSKFNYNSFLSYI